MKGTLLACRAIINGTKPLFLSATLAILSATAVAGESTSICLDMSRLESDETQSRWLPQKDYFYGREAADAFLEDRTVLLFRGTQPYAVPRTIDWNADPFQHSTWRLFFNSLGWIYAPLYSYVADGNEEAGIVAKAALLDWIRAQLAQSPTESDIKWNDQAAAFRLANFGEFERLLSPLLSADERHLLRSSIEQHVAFLEELFGNPRFYGNNHGFMDAMAVYSAGTEHQVEAWMQSGRGRLEALFREMFVEGVSIEQAFGYQTYKIQLMHEANCFAILNGHAPIETFSSTSREALEFISLVSYADLTLPAMGDTYFRMPIGSMRRYLNDTTASPITKYIWSDGKEGKAPPIVNVRSKGGYGVFWPNKDTRLVFDFSPAASGHNHNDGLNFTLFAKGEELIVDSAGPYAYGSGLRASYFNASLAHNVIVVNGEDRSGAARLIGYGETPSPWIQAETMLTNTKHIRKITMISPESITIRDDIESPENNDYELIFHLPPKAEIHLGEKTLISVGDATFVITVKAGDDSLAPTIGEGFVTPYTLELKSAPVLKYKKSSTDASIITAIEILQ